MTEEYMVHLLLHATETEAWWRTSFVSLTVDHYIIFPAGSPAVLLTDPSPTTRTNLDSLATHHLLWWSSLHVSVKTSMNFTSFILFTLNCNLASAQAL